MVADLVVTAILLISLLTDVRTKKIPNLLTFPGILAGFIIHGVQDGWPGLGQAVLGLLLGLALLFIPFALGGMGAGDVKLLGAVGALQGADFVLRAFLASALAGGALAVAALLWRRQLWASICWCGPALKSLFWRLATGGKLRLELAPFPAQGVGLPYGAAIAVGTLALLYWG